MNLEREVMARLGKTGMKCKECQTSALLIKPPRDFRQGTKLVYSAFYEENLCCSLDDGMEAGKAGGPEAS